MDRKCMMMIMCMLGYVTSACEVTETVPENYNMCYTVEGEREEQVVRNVVRKKWVLEEPTDCKSPFPCFGVVREIMVVESVTLLVSVCQLKPLWRLPRLIQETYNGVTLVLSLGYFQQKNFSDQIMCIWNITCGEGQALFVNSNYHNISQQEMLDDETSTTECGGEYVVIEWEEGREIRCIEQKPHHSQMNSKVFLNSIKIIFSSLNGGLFGNGLRLDTACYPMTLSQQIISDLNCSDNSNYLPSQDHTTLDLTTNEELQLMQTFSLHFDLHMLMDRCSRSVRECGIYVNKYHNMTSLITRQLDDLQSLPDTCNPLLNIMKMTTLDMYDY